MKTYEIYPTNTAAWFCCDKPEIALEAIERAGVPCAVKTVERTEEEYFSLGATTASAAFFGTELL